MNSYTSDKILILRFLQMTDGIQLKIWSLGGLRLTLDGHDLNPFVSRKADALLVYLAANPHPHSREALATLLWDDLPQSTALSYLRTVLASLQKQVADYLTVTRQMLAINTQSSYWLDCDALARQLDEAEQMWQLRGDFTTQVVSRLEEALTLYTRPFLEGFHIRDAGGFEQWMVGQQERLHMRVLQALYRLGEYGLRHQRYDFGIAYANRALNHDALWETAHRLLMRLLSASGQRSAALNQYDLCQQYLQDELGVSPEQETSALFQQIQDGLLSAPHETAGSVRPNNLRAPMTPLVGRETEMAQIAGYLSRPDCRLITLTGTGGIGKTRLALEVAHAHLSDYQDGVFFVSLEAVGKASQIAQTIIDAIVDAHNIQTQAYRPAEDTLVDFLKTRHLLLVLDNLEHLLEGVGFISRVMGDAPHVTVLATSRERLNLLEEWVLQIKPLPYDSTSDDADAHNGSAVQLFVDMAQRVMPDFSLEGHLDAVRRICQLIDGMPLAIELAASWVRVMSPLQIVEHIAAGLDILRTSLRNLPERHRSMRSVFDYSWSLLAKDEQQVFCKLAVFRGSFDLSAAQAITDASLLTLSSLVDKSMVVARDGRYTLHSLLRQFAEEKLADNAAILTQTYHRHAAYYADFAHEHGSKITSYFHPAFTVVMAEMDNIWAAWHYALDRSAAEPTLLNRFFVPFYAIYDVQSRYQGFAIFDEMFHALNLLDVPIAALSPVELRTRLMYGCGQEFISRFEEARQTIVPLLPYLETLPDNTWEMRVALRALGNIAYSLGDYAEALRYYQMVRVRLEAENNSDLLARLYIRISDAYAVLGDYTTARDMLRASIPHLNSTSGPITTMRFLITHGDVSLKLGDLSDARAKFEEAIKLSQQPQHRFTDAVALVSLARVAYAEGDYNRAEALARWSVERCDEIRNFWNKAFSLIHLARAHAAQGHTREADQWFEDAYSVSQEIGSRWLTASTLVYRAEMLCLRGQLNKARQDVLMALEIIPEFSTSPPPLALAALGVFATIQHQSGNRALAHKLAHYVLNHPIADFEARQLAARAISVDFDEEGYTVFDGDIETVIAAILYETSP